MRKTINRRELPQFRDCQEFDERMTQVKEILIEITEANIEMSVMFRKTKTQLVDGPLVTPVFSDKKNASLYLKYMTTVVSNLKVVNLPSVVNLVLKPDTKINRKISEIVRENFNSINTVKVSSFKVSGKDGNVSITLPSKLLSCIDSIMVAVKTLIEYIEVIEGIYYSDNLITRRLLPKENYQNIIDCFRNGKLVPKSLQEKSIVHDVYSKLILINNDLIMKTISNIVSFDVQRLLEVVDDGVNYIINIVSSDGTISNRFINFYRDAIGFNITYFNGTPIILDILDNEITMENCFSTGCAEKCNGVWGLGEHCECISVKKVLAILSILCSVKETANTVTERKKYTRLKNNKTNSIPVEKNYDILSVPDDISISYINKGKTSKEVRITKSISSSIKRPHERCGHYRHYKSGKTVYVEKTIVHKDKYRRPTTATYINR